MSHRCEFIVAGHGHDNVCDAPASIKRNGVWLCAEHYDFAEDNSVIQDSPYPASIAYDD